MIAHQRKRHLWMWMGITPLLALSIFTSVQQRPDQPIQDNPLSRGSHKTWIPSKAAASTAPQSPLAVEFGTWQLENAETTPAIRATLNAPLASPDLLLYWQEQKPGETLCAQAQFIGAFHPSEPNDYPAREEFSRGYFVLYSLGHGEIILHTSLAHSLTP